MGSSTMQADIKGSTLPVLEIQLGLGETVIPRHGWLASTPGITATVALQQTFRGGMFGGDGFLLQKLEGNGRAWIELSGELTKYTLAPGQSMMVHPGHV